MLPCHDTWYNQVKVTQTYPSLCAAAPLQALHAIVIITLNVTIVVVTHQCSCSP